MAFVCLRSDLEGCPTINHFSHARLSMPVASASIFSSFVSGTDMGPSWETSVTSGLHAYVGGFPCTLRNPEKTHQEPNEHER